MYSLFISPTCRIVSGLKTWVLDTSYLVNLTIITSVVCIYVVAPMLSIDVKQRELVMCCWLCLYILIRCSWTCQDSQRRCSDYQMGWSVVLSGILFYHLTVIVIKMRNNAALSSDVLQEIKSCIFRGKKQYIFY